MAASLLVIVDIPLTATGTGLRRRSPWQQPPAMDGLPTAWAVKRSARQQERSRRRVTR